MILRLETQYAVIKCKNRITVDVLCLIGMIAMLLIYIRFIKELRSSTLAIIFGVFISSFGALVRHIKELTEKTHRYRLCKYTVI